MRKRLLLALAGLVFAGILVLAHWQERGPNPTTWPSVNADSGASSQAVPANIDAVRAEPSGLDAFRVLVRRAEAGDPVAQRRLGERYITCMPFSLSPEVHKETLRQIAGLRGLPEPTGNAIATKVEQLCRDVDGGEPIPLEAGKLWLEQAANAGDLTARAKLATFNPEATTAEEVNDLLVSAVRESDPDALLAAAPLLGAVRGQGIDPRFATHVGNPNDEYAWAIAACRMGAACGPTSQIMTEICLSSLYCNYPNYEQFVRAELLPRGELDRVTEIIALVRGKRDGTAAPR